MKKWKRHRTRMGLFLSTMTWTAGLLLVFGAPAGAQQAPAQEKSLLNLPQPSVPQPQMFCGYCHILTYPNIVEKGYELWKKSKHKKFGCVACHYPPKGTGSTPEGSSSPVYELSHIPKKPPERFSYIPIGGDAVLTRPRVLDVNCMTSNCHGKPDDPFKTKEIKFTEKVKFIHKAHFEKKNQIEGQQIRCTSCHQHETETKKFEVSKATCYLCHFKNVKFNEGRSRCELCHELPKKPIQTSGQQPITHEILKQAKVSCGSCHYELIQAAGATRYEAYFEDGVLKTALVMGAGEIKGENCLACHDKAKELKEVKNKKLMHEKHVAVKNARCFDCHQPILHKKADLKRAKKEGELEKSLRQRLMRGRFVRSSCLTCHPEPHVFQRLLAAGFQQEGVPETPGFHLNARANCMACHVEKAVSKKGERVLKASAKACVHCHKGRENLLQDWKKDLEQGIQDAKEVEEEALEALEKAKPKLPPEKASKAQKMLAEGRKSLNLVRYGNGVHNKKYAMFLLDAAATHFEDLLDYLEEGE